MTPVVTLREHETRARSTFPDGTLDRLQTLDECGRQPAIDWSRRASICARNWVGTLQVRGLTVEILPKTGFGDVEPAVVQRRLLAMLARAGLLPVEERDLRLLHTERVRLWDAVAAAVAQRLARAIHAGVPHAYRRIEDEQPVIRGRLRVEVLVRGTPPRHECPPIAYDELTTDTALTRVLRDLAWRLHAGARSSAARRVTREPWALLAPLACDLLPRQAIPELGRNDRRFAPFVAFHRLLVEGRTTGLGSGGDATFSLLFPMERVFEAWVAGLLQRNAPELGIEGLHLQGGARPAYLVRDESRIGVGGLRPDVMVLHADGRPRCILDTKWKDWPSGEPGQADLYQAHAYATHWACRDTVLLAPSSGHRPPRTLTNTRDSATRIHIAWVRVDGTDEEALADLRAILGRSQDAGS